MPTTIQIADVQRLIAAGAQLVEVLPSNLYHDKHIPGAISLPLEQLDAKSAGHLRRDRPVITYCHDQQ